MTVTFGEIGDGAAEIAAARGRDEAIDVGHGGQRVAEAQELDPVFLAEPRLQILHHRLRSLDARWTVARLPRAKSRGP